MAHTETTMSQTALKSVVSLVTGLALAAVIGYVGYAYTANQAQAIRYDAINACMTAAQSTWNSTSDEGTKRANNTVVEPNTEWYQTCLTQKGIEVIK